MKRKRKDVLQSLIEDCWNASKDAKLKDFAHSMMGNQEGENKTVRYQIFSMLLANLCPKGNQAIKHVPPEDKYPSYTQ